MFLIYNLTGKPLKRRNVKYFQSLKLNFLLNKIQLELNIKNKNFVLFTLTKVLFNKSV